MPIVWTILIGGGVGLAARLLAPGTGPDGFLRSAALGIAGSALATYVGQFLGWYQAGQPAGLVAGLLGAIGLLAAYRVLFKPRPY